jgi:hypothetical protein
MLVTSANELLAEIRASAEARVAALAAQLLHDVGAIEPMAPKTAAAHNKISATRLHG